MNKSVSYMKYPKNIPKCYEFTRDKKYMLLAERRDCKDHCSIFACDNWVLLKVKENKPNRNKNIFYLTIY
jgi:hypothetical protein